MIRTKIVATLGPATADVPTLTRLFHAGVDVVRLNFSHGSLEEHLQMLGSVRQAAIRAGQPVGILGDLCGPKIRLGAVADVDARGGMPIRVGDTLVIQRQPMVGASGRVSTTYAGFVDDVREGDRIYIEDGLLRFIAIEKRPDEIVASCTAGGILRTAKGVNLPNTPVRIASITERDWECVQWAIKNDLDYLALSFVRQADEVLALREHLDKYGSDIHIISKIEKHEAVLHVDEILEASDGLMIARGDLGVELDVARVPIIQKDLIRRCHAAGKPVIVATQMLQSMIDQATPTRAEVSDIANAIIDGTDAVMLSGETSIGKFPVAAVHTMNHVAEVTEKYLNRHDEAQSLPEVESEQLSAGLARGARRIVHDLRAKLVVLWSRTGMTARIFAKSRFPVPIVAFGGNERVQRRMAMYYGVLPCAMEPSEDLGDFIARADAYLQQRKLGRKGDRILLVAGSSALTPGAMNALLVHTIGEPWTATPHGEAPTAAAL